MFHNVTVPTRETVLEESVHAEVLAQTIYEERIKGRAWDDQGARKAWPRWKKYNDRHKLCLSMLYGYFPRWEDAYNQAVKDMPVVAKLKKDIFGIE